MSKRVRKIILIIDIIILIGFTAIYLLQRFWAHRKEAFVPNYPQIVLTKDTDYHTFFLQTGLGKTAVDKLIKEDRFDLILKYQEAFMNPDEMDCVQVRGRFTMSERVKKEETVPLVDLQPGDIILSLSTHSVGWRHGHSGLVIDEDSVLECLTYGVDSKIIGAEHWRQYSNYVVLRIKEITTEEQKAVVDYAKEYLCGKPYHLSAGLVGDKAPDVNGEYFGMQCSYLVWYAWQHLGYDLDSDGGRLVTATDLLQSDLLEVVQVYGMDPREFE